MSSFNADKREEHEIAAEKELQKGNYVGALANLIQAGRYSLKLAEASEGELAVAHLTRARKLRMLAEQILPKAMNMNKYVPADGNSDGDDSEMRLAELPSERLADVSGMEAAKKEVLLKVIAPIKDPDAKKYGLYPGGCLLLYGLPGTGKTFFAKAVAGELGLPFYVLDTSKIMNKYVGESQKAVKELFDTARANPMSVIFIDEIDSVLMSRNGADVHETSKQVTNIILQELDGIDSCSKNPFLLIGATNYPGKLDEAALSRFSACIEVQLPDKITRAAIFKRNFFDKLDSGIKVEDGVMEFLVIASEGFSCRDLVNLSDSLRGQAYISKLAEIKVDFCREYFAEFKMQSKSEDVAESIAEFKKRSGISGDEQKKK